MTYRISNFARTQGAKDKKERKRRNVGGMVAGGVAGAAGLGAAARYGGAEASTRLAERALYNNAKNAENVNIYKRAISGGAKGALSRDLQRLDDARAAGMRGIYTAKDKIGELAGKASSHVMKHKGRYAARAAALAALGGGAAYIHNRNKKKKQAQEAYNKTLGGRASALKSKIKERLGR